MNKAITKFINYFEESKMYVKKIIKECPEGCETVFIDGTYLELCGIQDEKNNLEKLIIFFKTTDDESIYKYFSFISYYLENSPLKMREKMAVLFYIVKKNQIQLTKYPERISRILDLNILHKLYAPTMNLEKFNQFIHQQNVNELINKKMEILTPKEILLRQKILEAEKDTENEHKLFIKVHQYIEDHYFRKENNYTKKDIKFIEVALKKLGVSKKLISAFISILTTDLEKRKPIQESRIDESKSMNKENFMALSTKEYNEIFKEIEIYYDIQEHKIIKALTEEEIIYLVSLMLKINIPLIEIKKCIQNINWHGWSAYTNPIMAYNDYYGKLKNNSSVVEVEIVIKSINELIGALFIPENEEEYLFWKQEIANELKKVRNILNQDDGYELGEARKLIIKEEK